MIPILLVAITALLVAGLGLWSMKRLILVAAPDELLVIVGRKPNPQAPARRLTRGGRAVRLPLLERAFRFDLVPVEVPFEVCTRSQTLLPLMVRGLARVRMAHEVPEVDHALRRLGGLTRAEVAGLARRVIEGELSALAANLTPEELRNDRDEAAAHLRELLEEPLQALGLELEHLTLTGVTDEVGYLDALETIARLSP